MVLLPEPGDDWGGFRIDREIGRSTRARTYAAFDPITKRTRALKVLSAVPSDDPAGERFQRHPLAATELGHPNIVVTHAASDVDGVAYVVMDLYPLGSIADELGVSVLRLTRARDVLSQVASALDTAHEAGLVHGNVKPSNILCGDDGLVALSDFGCTRFVDDALRREPVDVDDTAGLPFHEAPEVLVGDPIGPAADTYSLTSIFYEMLTGRTPFSGRSAGELTQAHRSAPVPTVTSLRPDLPVDLDEFVARGMAKEAQQRFASGVEFVAALDITINAALEHRRVQARQPRPETPADPFEAPADPFEPPSDRVEAAPSPQPVDDVVSQGPDTATVPATATTYGGSRRARRQQSWRLEDGTIDGAVVGVFEDEPRRRWVGVVVAVVLVVAIAVVGWLVFRAVQADSETSTTAAQQTVSAAGSSRSIR